MKKTLLFILICSVSLIKAQDCNYYFQDDKKGNGDLWIKELFIDDLNSKIITSPTKQIVLNDNQLYLSTNIAKEEISTLIQLLNNYNFIATSTITTIDSLNFKNTQSKVIVYRISKKCLTNPTVEEITFFKVQD